MLYHGGKTKMTEFVQLSAL